MIELLLILAFAFATGAAPPFRWGARLAVGVLTLLTIAVTIEPVPYDPGWGDDLARAGVAWLTIAFLAGVSLRGLIFGASDHRPTPRPVELTLLTGADCLLGLLIGVWLGCLIFLVLAVLLAGHPGGLTLHVAILTLASLITFAAFAALVRWRSPVAGIITGASLLIAALTFDSGWHYPDLILAQAARIQPGQPRCLMLGPDLQLPRTRADLMALTMAKDRTGPSDAVLLIQTDTSPYLKRWSFRARQFVESGDLYEQTGRCTPTTLPLLPE